MHKKLIPVMLAMAVSGLALERAHGAAAGPRGPLVL